ncbi:P-loop containing nucleoside triphosphate hydrolase protein [Thamnocephalis sphaerospora]|uniref:P-loop containing nucleoside triphosphate hydrolase protein n=1 Tax=Thamnocephalis sphaerospora TaxID=78915 RepID=A0A4P9XNJ4_9FUNG|nr:P-loop containing nucleoside triphosphate hydrolase protein [Thamnocephalis sphaerospora]|eukprot:RKP07534.1 P-loop containing nucleoside triphosphate hydrolase protein [Thamnocephalis sphaerospora]
MFCTGADIFWRLTRHDHDLEHDEVRLAIARGICVVLALGGLLCLRGSAKGTATGRCVTLEASASIVERLSFAWLTPLLAVGYRRQLNDTDLWELVHEDKAAEVTQQFALCQRASLVRTLVATLRGEMLKQIIYGTIWAVLTYASPYLLGCILRYVDDETTSSHGQAWAYVFGMFASLVGASIALQQGHLTGKHIQTRCRAAISNLVFAKCMRRQAFVDLTQTSAKDDAAGGSAPPIDSDKAGEHGGTVPKEWDSGAVTNLLNVDSQNVGEAFSYTHLFFGSAVQVAVALTLLSYLIGWATAFGVMAMIPVYLLSKSVSRRFSIAIRRLMEAADRRLSIIGEMLHSMRIIKFFAWEPHFLALIAERREYELEQLWHRLLMFVEFIVITHSGSVIIMCAALGAYILLFDHTLTAPVAFTVLSVFGSLRSAVEQLPDMLYWAAQCRMSSQRIEAFLSLPELDRRSEVNEQATEDSDLLGCVDAEFRWSARTSTALSLDDTDNDSIVHHQAGFMLRDINVTFQPGALNVIAGSTGSGKTSLLMALLGEMPCIRGRILRPGRQSLAYAAQQAWLQNISIRDNILFGQAYDEARYRHVLHACALERDLEILDAGDHTQIGERGVTLSGGQKQRVALARAVYSPAQYLLLDDCLSAVDAHTARHIMEKCLLGPLMQGRTRILVTHHVDLCTRRAAMVLVVHAGRVVAQGLPSEILTAAETVLDNKDDELNTVAEDLAKDGLDEGFTQERNAAVPVMTTGIEDTPAALDAETSGRLVEEEEREEGGVKLGMYAAYLRAGGSYAHWAGILLVIVAMQMVAVGQIYWLRVWTNKSSDSALGETGHLVVYFLLSVALFFSIAIRHIVVVQATVRASRVLHQQLVESIMHATVRFFDKTPVGRIMNRFSKDFNSIDQELPISLGFIVVDALEQIALLAIVCAVMPTFIIGCIPLVFLYISIGAYFVNASRDLKRLESVAKSPFLSLLTESLSGVTTIRAFGATERFLSDSLAKIDAMHRPLYLLNVVTLWMSLQCEFLSAVISLVSSAFFVVNHNNVDAGLAGFLLSYAIMFFASTSWLLRSYGRNEMAMNGVERVMEYINTPREPPAIIEHCRPDTSWPHQGAIQVEDLSVRYATDQAPVISNLTFSVRPGERVGLVGRTGAGKSTLATAFFRFVEAADGRIIIDGVDISQIGLRDLRSRLTIIPQDPVLFSGTLRSNLDPLGMHNDEAIWNALRRCHLIGHDGTDERPAGLEHLDAPVAEYGANFSQGQRQLLAMARALLVDNRIILMDEATASVDFDTDARIQQTIREALGHVTLLCIAHRLRTVMDYDRILVLDAGRLIEYDTPAALIRRPHGLFRQLCEQSGELEALLNMVHCDQVTD